MVTVSVADRLRKLGAGWDRLSLAAVRYLKDGAETALAGSGEGLPTAWRLPVYIVARPHYFEYVQDYPLASLAELRRVLRFEAPQGPFRGPVVQRIVRLGEQSFRVTRWVLKPKALPPLAGKPALLMPETALLPRDGALHRFPHGDGTLLHYDGPEGLRSALLSHPEDAPRLLEAMGAASAPEAAQPSGSFQEASLLEALEAGLRSLPLAELPGFWHFQRPTQAPFPWARAGLLGGALLASYLTLSSLGLLLHHSYLNFELRRQSDAIDAALATQRTLRAAEQRLEERAELLGSGAPGWTLWPVIVDLTLGGMQLNALRFEDGEVTLFGAAPRATDLLEQAGRHPLSVDARFIQPVRQGADGESFALRFTPRPLPAPAAPDA